MEQDSRLGGRVALVTGAARRLGAAIASAFHRAGASVVVHYGQSRAEAEALVASFNAVRPDSALASGCNLLELQTLPKLVETAHARWGRLDILVNNASTFYPTAIGSITPAQWDDLVGTNLRAPLFLAQACAPALRTAQGSIINMVDIHAQRPLKTHTVYSVAKAGLVMLTKALARELAPDVRVNGIAPGPVLWPERIDPALQAEIVAKTALKRSGSPDDVARAALYLAADAPFVTGQVIAVDGGRSL